MPTCLHCLAETPDEYYRRVVYNEAALFGPWRGWRMVGKYRCRPMVTASPWSGCEESCSERHTGLGRSQLAYRSMRSI